MKSLVPTWLERLCPPLGRLNHSFFRYLAVQCGAYVLDMGGFLIMFHLVGTGVILAHVCGRALAAVSAFFVHRSFTFGISTKEGRTKEALMFFALVALNLPITSLLLFLFMVVIPYPVVAKVISDTIWVLLNYWLSRNLVFTTKIAKDTSAP